MVAALSREICTDCVLTLIHGMHVLMGYIAKVAANANLREVPTADRSARPSD